LQLIFIEEKFVISYLNIAKKKKKRGTKVNVPSLCKTITNLDIRSCYRDQALFFFKLRFPRVAFISKHMTILLENVENEKSQLVKLFERDEDYWNPDFNGSISYKVQGSLEVKQCEDDENAAAELDAFRKAKKARTDNTSITAPNELEQHYYSLMETDVQVKAKELVEKDYGVLFSASRIVVPQPSAASSSTTSTAPSISVSMPVISNNLIDINASSPRIVAPQANAASSSNSSIAPSISGSKPVDSNNLTEIDKIFGGMNISKTVNHNGYTSGKEITEFDPNI